MQQFSKLIGSKLSKVITKSNTQHMFLGSALVRGVTAEIVLQVSTNGAVTYTERGENYTRNFILRRLDDMFNLQDKFPKKTLRLCDQILSVCVSAEKEIATKGLVPSSYKIRILVHDDFKFEYKVS